MTVKHQARAAVWIAALAAMACGVGYAQGTNAPKHAAASRPTPPPAAVIAGIPVNYDQSKVGVYTLPNPLMLPDGKPVLNAETWYKVRRPQILKLFEEDQYGRSPGRPAAERFEVVDHGTPALGGKALRRQVTIYLTAKETGPKIHLLIYLPAAAHKPVPLLMYLSFRPNSQTVNDPGVKPGEIWDPRENKMVSAVGRKGFPFPKINVAQVLDAGFGFATFYYDEVDPDSLRGFPYGIRATYLKPGQTQRAPDAWGSIAAWAWGLSRAMDYLETDKGVDAKRVAIMGVSRLGKTVLWAGARDTRFALVIASCSGEGGAALSRRNYGETIAHLVAPTRFPYQFAENYAKYAGFPDKAPMDANMLLALIAPRPVLLQTGSTDFWSDPKGEFLAAVAAGPVYRLLGGEGLGTDVWPPAGEPILHTIGYYMHNGGHGALPADWAIFLKFMTMHLHPGQ